MVQELEACLEQSQFEGEKTEREEQKNLTQIHESLKEGIYSEWSQGLVSKWQTLASFNPVPNSLQAS